MARPNLKSMTKDQCKLELGDILVLQGKVWDASLNFMQVEKKYKHDVLGHEAKFRIAKIAFYTGDFGWAQLQLDVLKGSTSKLIANDALDLSLLIKDNVGFDSVYTPLEMFARSELLVLQHKYEEAIACLDSIENVYQYHLILDNVMFQRHIIYSKKGMFEEAIAQLHKLVSYFPGSLLVDDALFRQADIFENQLKNMEKARELYKTIMVNHSGSLHSIESRKRFRALRGDEIN